MEGKLVVINEDDRDILEILKAELDFIEKGGYGRSVKKPWEPTLIFQDSLICIGFPNHTHDDVCALMRFVPPEHRSQCVPCHYIPLNEDGETVETIGSREDQQQLEEAVKDWLRARIREIEEERVAQEAV